MAFGRRPGFRPSSLSMNAVAAAPALVLGKPALLRALAHVMHDETRAQRFLQDVLWDAGFDDVPDGRAAFEVFVREEVLPRLLPLARLEEVHDLVRRTIGEEGSLHPPPLRAHGAPPAGRATTPVRRPRVVVVEPEDGRRLGIARELVRGGMDVEALTRPGDVLSVDAFHAVVMRLGQDARQVIETLAGQRTRAGLVTYDDATQRDLLKRTIERWPNDRVAVVPLDAAAPIVASRVRIVVA